MLKVSGFYLEKQKSFIPKKALIQAVVSRQAKRVPTDGALPSQFSVNILAVTMLSIDYSYSNRSLTVGIPLQLAG